jgi:hypothetical protein
MEENSENSLDMISKEISEKELSKFKNIIDDNKKIYNIKRTIATTTESVEGLLVVMGDLLRDLHEVKMEVDDIESRLHEKFELLNDKFFVFLDELMKNKELDALIEVLLEDQHFQEKVIERILQNKKQDLNQLKN